MKDSRSLLRIKLSCRRFPRRSYGLLYLASDFYGSPGGSRNKGTTFRHVSMVSHVALVIDRQHRLS